MDSKALTGALRRGDLAGCVIDVWENEPHIDMELLALADIATPHIAGYSLDGKANGTAQSVREINRFFGLGMDNWYPDNIPAPDNGMVKIKMNDLIKEQLFQKIFYHTYNIKADSLRLKSDPGSFEQLRDNYPPRREFGAYRLDFKGSSGDLSDSFIDSLLKLGFRM